MEVGARSATPDDVDELAALAQDGIDELRPGRGGEVWYRSEARRGSVADTVRRDLESSDVEVAVGTIDDVPVGYGVLRLRDVDAETRYGVISDIYTLPGARGVGVGEAMMNHLIERAKSHGCVGVDSMALPGDRHTKNFFESFGLVARAILVHRSLVDRPRDDD